MHPLSSQLSARAASRAHRHRHKNRKEAIHNPEQLRARIQQMVASHMDQLKQGDSLSLVLRRFERSLAGCPQEFIREAWQKAASAFEPYVSVRTTRPHGRKEMAPSDWKRYHKLELWVLTWNKMHPDDLLPTPGALLTESAERGMDPDEAVLDMINQVTHWRRTRKAR